MQNKQRINRLIYENRRSVITVFINVMKIDEILKL